MGKTKIPVLKTKRLAIVPRTRQEMEQLVKNERNPELVQAYTQMLEEMERDPKNWLWYTDWGIYLKKEKTLVGGIGFKGPANEVGEVEVGYGTDEPFRRNGYALEALKEMVDYAFDDSDVYYVIAQTEEDNTASQELLKKAEFEVTDYMGEEGPIFVHKRPVVQYIAMYMGLGLCCGVAYGISFNNLPLGLCIGIVIGFLLGNGIDSNMKAKSSEMEKMWLHSYEKEKEEWKRNSNS